MSRVLRILAWAACAGIVIGFVESLPLRLARSVRVPVRLSEHFVWMLPLMDGVLLVLLIGAVLAGARVLGRRAGPGLLVGVTAGFAALALLLIIEVLHPLASLLLAAGIGRQVARLADRGWMGTIRRWLPAAALLVLVAGGVQGALHERGLDALERRRAAGEAIPPPGAPNVLLVILDTARAWELGVYGAEGDPTPALDAFARRGVVFETAVAPSPWTLPGHASIFTGRWPEELGIEWGGALEQEHATLAEVMAGGGFLTAGFSANLLNASRYTGLDQGFQRWEDFEADLGSAVFASSILRTLSLSEEVRALLAEHEDLTRQPARAVNRRFLDWVDERALRSPRPFFAFLNWFDAHEPHFPDPALRSPRKWNDFVHRGGVMLGENTWVADKWELTPEEVEVHRASYRDAVRRADGAFAELWAGLEARGLDENTVVIVTADHGEQLGENGLFGHDNSLYPAALHVPLLIVAPGRIPAAVRVTTPVSTRELAATVLRLVGAPEGIVPGVPLDPLWGEGDSRVTGERGLAEEGAADREIRAHLTLGSPTQPGTPIELGDGIMISRMRGHWQWIRNGDGSEELYDWRTDPAATRNLVDAPEAAAVLARFRAEFEPGA